MRLSLQRKIHKAAQKKLNADLRSRVTIKTLQKGGRIVATVDPVTGRVLKREKNPRYVPKDKKFSKLLAKKRAEQSKC
jgi:hypothetical protein